MAAQDADYFQVDAHFRGKNNVDMPINPAKANAEQGILAQRFFVDKFMGWTGKHPTTEVQGHGFWGLCYLGSANFFMHRLSRQVEVHAPDQSRDYVTFNDAGLNTLGLPIFIDKQANAVNYIEFVSAVLQPWFGAVSSCEIEFWANGSRVYSVTLDLTSPIPDYDFGDSLDSYSPALDITRARAYRVQLSPALDVAALDSMSYDLRYRVGDETGYKQYLATQEFPLTAPVSQWAVKRRPSGGCDSVGEITTNLFTEIERVKLIPGQPDPPRIIYREPDGDYVWCAQDIDDFNTVFYTNTALTTRADGFFYGVWGLYVVEIQNGLQLGRVNCPIIPILPPRDIDRFTVIIDSTVINGSVATVTYTVTRDLANGGDSGEVQITVSLDDGVGSTLNTSTMIDGATTIQSTIDHQIKNPSFTGMTAKVETLTWVES